jgi:hypothetical protein
MMTRSEARAEAERRWGPLAFARTFKHSPGLKFVGIRNNPHMYWLGDSELAIKRDGMETYGAGPTWK